MNLVWEWRRGSTKAMAAINRGMASTTQWSTLIGTIKIIYCIWLSVLLLPSEQYYN